MIDLFKLLYNTPRSVIYALVCQENMKVYISYSKNVVTSLGRLLSDVQDKKCIYKHLIDDASKLEFKVLDSINISDTSLDVALKLDHNITLYKQLGYSLYNDKYKLQKLKVAIEVDDDLKRIFVRLKSQDRHKSIVVGVFDKMWDAEEFACCFESMSIIKPIYATNTLSIEYFKTLK